MTAGVVGPRPGRRCTATALWLVPAAGEDAYRVAKDRHGALSAPPRDDPALAGEDVGRFDTVGTTIYFADSRQCAYGEVLAGFRLERAKLQLDADAAGYDLDEYIELVTQQAMANDLDTPWAISCDWQMARSIYQIRLPSSGWWVKIDAAETLNALIEQFPHRRIRDHAVLTLADVTGEDRELTRTLAQHIRDLTLDDGHRPLGIAFPSKSAYGRCWAFWDRRKDDALGRGSDDPEQVAAWNIGPDAAFIEVARDYSLKILPARG